MTDGINSSIRPMTLYGFTCSGQASSRRMVLVGSMTEEGLRLWEGKRVDGRSAVEREKGERELLCGKGEESQLWGKEEEGRRLWGKTRRLWFSLFYLS